MRGGLLVVVSVLLFILFLVGNVLWTLDKSLEYEVIKPEIVAVVGDASAKIVGADVIENSYSLMLVYCEFNSEYILEYGDEMALVIPCDVISQGLNNVINYSVEEFVDEVYYKEYDCEFVDCVKTMELEKASVLVSKKAQDYWHGKFYLVLMASLVLIVVMFFLVEQKTNLFILVGALLAVSALPFMKINAFLNLISFEFIEFIGVFFSQADSVFLISFSVGVVAIAVGIAFKFFGLGFKISKLMPVKGKKVVVEKTKVVKPVKGSK